jgi:Icc-related predicted phosphoesterase
MWRSIGATAISALTIAGCSPDDPHSQPSTPAARFPATATLLVVGDWGAGTPEQAQVATAMSEYAYTVEVAAILTTGDNFYFDNPDSLMEPFAWAEDATIPFVVSWGNHDIETPARIGAVQSEFEYADRWGIHEWGPLDIVVLDSTQVDSEEQLAFFDAAMAGSEDPTIVVFHHPPYSCGSHGGTEAIRENWVARFDDDVFLVLSGHEHNYQRFEFDGVSYVVTGGGGRFLTPLAECAPGHLERLFGLQTHNFVAMSLDDELTVEAFDAQGNVIDIFSLPLPSGDGDQ